MEGVIKVVFVKTNYKAKVFFIMQMDKFIMETIFKVKKKDKDVFILIKIQNMQEILGMGKWMVMEYILKKIKKFMEFGEMEN